MSDHRKFSGIAFVGRMAVTVALMIAITAVSSCKRTINVPTDPKVAEAYAACEAVFALFDSAQDQDAYALSGQAAAAMTELSTQLQAQQGKYSNPKQQLQLRNVTMSLMEIAARADVLQYNVTMAEVESFRTEWNTLKPDMQQFVGPVGEGAAKGK